MLNGYKTIRDHSGGKVWNFLGHSPPEVYVCSLSPKGAFAFDITTPEEDSVVI